MTNKHQAMCDFETYNKMVKSGFSFKIMDRGYQGIGVSITKDNRSYATVNPSTSRSKPQAEALGQKIAKALALYEWMFES